MSTSKLEIIRRACANSGHGTIDSIDDNAEIARLVSTHYEAIAQDLLTTAGWNFARRTATLTELATPDAVLPWTNIYAAPADMLALRMVQTDQGMRIDHEEADTDQGKAINVIACTGDVVIASYIKRVAEDRWPGDFAMVVQLRMEAVFLRAAEQVQEANLRDRAAEMRMQRARVRDRSASTGADPSDWDLTAARYSNRRWDQFRVR